ncbi:hypothetical protein MPAR168_08505 [Methylorubrum populi]|uniref:Uncharacterized protein n=1 Tax=Methylobacterium radiotolerans TaxID=31998 RepID=A0ABU7T6Y9_9HYPH
MPALCFVAINLAGMLASGKPARDARAYLYIGPSTLMSPVVTGPNERPHAQIETTNGALSICVGETPAIWPSGLIRASLDTRANLRAPFDRAPTQNANMNYN